MWPFNHWTSALRELKNMLTNDSQACWQIWEVYHRKRWQIWSKVEKSWFVANPRVLKDNCIGFTWPFLKPNKSNTLMLLWPKLINFQVKKCLAVGLCSIDTCGTLLEASASLATCPRCPLCWIVPIPRESRDSKTLERWEPPVSSLWALLPHSSLTTEQNSQKTRHFSRRWHYFLASPAVNPWSLRGFADVVLPSQAVATTLI